MLELTKLSDTDIGFLLGAVEVEHDAIRRGDVYTDILVEVGAKWRNLLEKEYRRRNLHYSMWEKKGDGRDD